MPPDYQTSHLYFINTFDTIKHLSPNFNNIIINLSLVKLPFFIARYSLA